MIPDNLRDALFLRMAEILPTLELFTFDEAGEEELVAMQRAWAEMKADVLGEVVFIKAQAEEA